MRPIRQIDQLVERDVPWFDTPVPGEASIALCSRLRLSRNISGYPFPGQADVAQRREIQLRVAEAVAGIPALSGCLQFDVTNMDTLDQQILVERQLLDVMPGEHTEGVSVCVSLDEGTCLVTNDLDHLRLCLTRQDSNLEQLWSDADKADTALGAQLEWAFSPELGYLTARPQDMGTAMFASVVLHLPGLVLAGCMDQVANGLSHMGLVMNGLITQEGQACGNLFEISNQSALGCKEATLVERLSRVASSMIVQEKHARQSLLEQNPAVLFDYVGRAYGTLCNVWSIGSQETLSLLSAVRLGVELGMLPALAPETLSQVFIRSQPAHLQRIVGRRLDDKIRENERALWVRQWLGAANREASG